MGTAFIYSKACVIWREPVMEMFQVGKNFFCSNAYILIIHCWKYFTCLIFATEFSGKDYFMAEISWSAVYYSKTGVKMSLLSKKFWALLEGREDCASGKKVSGIQDLDTLGHSKCYMRGARTRTEGQTNMLYLTGLGDTSIFHFCPGQVNDSPFNLSRKKHKLSTVLLIACSHDIHIFTKTFWVSIKGLTGSFSES